MLRWINPPYTAFMAESQMARGGAATPNTCFATVGSIWIESRPIFRSPSLRPRIRNFPSIGL